MAADPTPPSVEPDPSRAVTPPYPAETIVQAYVFFVIVSAWILVPASWSWVLAWHLAAAPLVELVRRTPRPSSPLARRLRALYPLATFPILYHVTGRLNVHLPHWVLTRPLEQLEATLFGGHPSLYLAERLPFLALSEALHLCYFSYYALVLLLPIALAAQGRERDLEHVVHLVCLCFAVCLAFYIWLPVESPYYAYPAFKAPLSDGPFYRLAHFMSGRGGVVGGAFPSSHAALATLVLLLAHRLERRVFWWTLAPTVGLAFATVYARYHVAVDTVAGIALAVGVFIAFGRGRWLERDGVR